MSGRLVVILAALYVVLPLPVVWQLITADVDPWNGLAFALYSTYLVTGWRWVQRWQAERS